MKKIIVTFLVGCGLVVGLILIILSQVRQSVGHLIVQTNDPTAKITLISKSTTKEFSIGTGKEVEATINAGQYMLQVFDQNRVSQTALNVPNKGNVTVSISINPIDKLNEIANFSAQDLSVAGSDIEFLNTALQQIYDYNFSTGAEHTIASDLYPVTNLLWANHQLAIAIDEIGNPHLLSGQNDSVLPITTTSSNNPAVQDFTVNVVGDYAYAQGGNIYVSKVGKILNLGQNNSAEILVRLANDDTLFVNSINPTNPKVTTVDVGIPTQSSAYFINASGQKITYPGTDTINEAAWSPDSQTIAVSTNNDFTTYNYKTYKTTVVTQRGISPNGSFNWLNNNDLLYVDKGIIWDYNLSQNVSHKLVAVPGTINHATPFAISDDGGIYFSTDSESALGSGAAIIKLSP